MPTISNLPSEVYSRSRFLDSLPRHKTFWPPIQRPETWFEMIFGPAPKVEAVPRYIYESTEEGFYNFYIENYKNIYFLPDWLSEFIQVRLNICLDITVLETIREVLFVGLMVYSQIVILTNSIILVYLYKPVYISMVLFSCCCGLDRRCFTRYCSSHTWSEYYGKCFFRNSWCIADSLNHLVFTMPFLPSEGEETKLLINQQMKDVLVFHYLPILWYRYPIPNEIENFGIKKDQIF
jgi:hypothetical protein